VAAIVCANARRVWAPLVEVRPNHDHIPGQAACVGSVFEFDHDSAWQSRLTESKRGSGRTALQISRHGGNLPSLSCR